MEEDKQKEQGQENGKKFLSPVVIGGVVVVLVILIGGFVLLKGNSSSSFKMAEESTTPINEESMEASDEKMAEGDAMMEDSDVKVIDVEGGSFYFKPNEITVKKGQKVKIVLNAVSLQHDFVIDEFNVKSDTVPSGQSTEVTFTPDKTGEFEFYCSIGNHRAQGMVGKLIVTE